jgi:hypothetical protein
MSSRRSSSCQCWATKSPPSPRAQQPMFSNQLSVMIEKPS